jgi:hypothetical protein
MRVSVHIDMFRVGCTAFLVAALFTGCGSSNNVPLVVPPPNAPVGLPTPAAPTPVNTYFGVQSPGAWSFTLNNSQGNFSFQPVTYSAPIVSGSLASSGGFSMLDPGAVAYEVLSRAAVLRPGDNNSMPVFGVPQTECYAITGRLRFQYIPMFAGVQDSGPNLSQPTAPSLGYGSVVASTDATGANWQFTNLQGGTWNSKNGNIVSGPDSFSGTCATANGGASIKLTGSSVLNTAWTPGSATPGTGMQSTIWIGPSGFFAADQIEAGQSVPTGASVAGVAEPPNPLNTSDVSSSTYLGMMYIAANTVNYGNGAAPTPASTMPVGFGQVVPGTATTTTGGIFPNDDVTGTPNSDIQISLGAQDETLNGLYTSASITVLDPAQNCANFSGNIYGFSLAGVVTTGVNAQGYTTCTFPAVAVVGQPEGNYAVFVNSYNWAIQFGGAPVQFYLFQQ